MPVELKAVLNQQLANKRRQLCQAIPLVETKIMVLANGDVKWPPTILTWLLAPFKDPEIGGVGTSQRVIRLRGGGVNYIAILELV